MYSCSMPMPILSMNGTGLAGALRDSSWPSSAAAAHGRPPPRRPPAWEEKDLGVAFFGGQESCLCQTFVPVSNTHASGVAEVEPSALSRRSKKGSSMCSRKYSPVLALNATSPSLSPSPRFQPPCTHGPITSMLLVLGDFFLTFLYTSSAPKRFSASNQPPTVSTSGLTSFRC